MPSNPEPLLQGLPPILPDGKIKALILGSFPSVASLKHQQYYAHPKTLLARLGTLRNNRECDRPYEERIAQVRAANLAIWDLYEKVTRPGSSDDQIRNEVPNDIEALWQTKGPSPSS